MTTIGLIRHGLTDWNELGKAQGLTDISLNEAGLKQANALARRVSNEHWDIVYSSDLSRAIQTSELLCASLGIDRIITDSRLRELCCGLIEGTTEDERISRWGEDWRSQNIEMEPYDQVAGRGIEILEEINIKHEGKNILIVSHGALIGLTLQKLMPEVFPTTYMDNASLTIIKRNAEGWACSLYNCTKHFCK